MKSAKLRYGLITETDLRRSVATNIIWLCAKKRIDSTSERIRMPGLTRKVLERVNISAEVSRFIVLLIGPAFSIKYFGFARTLWAAFAISFLVCLWILPLIILHEVHQYHDFLTLPGLLVPAVFAVQGATSGMACWTLWKRRLSARFWAIAASLMNILISLLTLWSKVHFSRPIRDCSVAILVFGVTGLIVFSRRTINYPSAYEEQPDA
jgi:hypothetical protein